MNQNNLFFSVLFVFTFLICIFQPAFASIGSSDEVIDRKEIKNYIFQFSDTLDYWKYDVFLSEEKRKKLIQNLKDFYEARDYQPSWINQEKKQLSAIGCNLLDKMEQSYEEGLIPDFYQVPSLREGQDSIFGMENINRKAAASLDFNITQAYLTYLKHLTMGYLEPSKVDTAFVFEVQKRDLLPILHQAVEEENLEAALSDLVPKVSSYQYLKRALFYYEKIKNDSSLAELPSDLILKEGETHESVPTLAAYLIASGDLPVSYWRSDRNEENKPIEAEEKTMKNEKKNAGEESFIETKTDTGKSNDTNDEVYSKEIVEAVVHFQKRHDLTADGIIGPNTLEVLKVPIDKRIQQMCLNMERMRWLPNELGEKYVWVNIPAFRLYFMEDEEVTLDMNVVVGEYYNPTPAFRDEISHIVFSPTWTPTPEIATDDLLPKIKRNPNYFEEKNMVVYEDWSENAKKLKPKKIKWSKVEADNFPYKLVQQPGPENSLGQVKFMFPNEMFIYLHDTSAKSLFDKEERDASHGCVRVADPVGLGVKLLEENAEDWTSEKIKEYMNKSKPHFENLAKSVPVYLVYFTVWADEEGYLSFEEDVYDFDESQYKYMKQ